MGEVTFTSLGIAVIMVSMVVLGYTAWVTELSVNYGIPVNMSLPNTANKLLEITNLTNEINNQVVNDDTTAGDPLASFASQGATAVKISLSGVSLVRAMLLDSSEYLGVPSWFVTSLIAILLLILGLLALTVLMRAFQKL